jgi:hypothetical protein
MKKSYFGENRQGSGRIRVDDLKARSEEWEKRGVYNSPRLEEVTRLYKDLGFAVRLEPFEPGSEENCRECICDNPEAFKVLYTKKRQNEK